MQTLDHDQITLEHSYREALVNKYEESDGPGIRTVIETLAKPFIASKHEILDYHKVDLSKIGWLSWKGLFGSTWYEETILPNTQGNIFGHRFEIQESENHFFVTHIYAHEV